jgi:hypothetical protein
VLTGRDETPETDSAISSEKPTSSDAAEESAVVKEPEPEATELDGYLIVDGDGVYIDAADGEKVRLLDRTVAAAYDDGEGGMIFQDLRSTEWGPSGAPWELALESPASEQEGTIWHLPAGATEPEPLLTSADIARDWVGLIAAGPLGDRNVVVYARGSYDPSRGELEATHADLVVHDLADGTELHTVRQAWGYEWGVATVELPGDLLAYLSQGEGISTWTFLDESLQVLNTPCSESFDYDQTDCGSGAVDEEGRIVSLEYSETGESVSGVRVVDLRSGAELRRFDNPGSVYLGDGSYRVEVDAQGGQAIVSYLPIEGADPQPAVQYDLDAEGSEPSPLEMTGWVLFPSAPLVRP